jgi:hypothetical protein
MKELSSWTPRRVIWACVMWLLGAPVLGALGLILGTMTLAGLSGRQRIGLTVKITDLSAAWLFLPPIILVGAWIWSRTRKRRSASNVSVSDRA